jgi:hypothetical protein
MKAVLIRVLVLGLLVTLGARAAHADWSHDPRFPNPLIPYTTSNQRADAALADGNGGVYVFFEDDRNGNRDVFGMHVLANGTDDPAWPLNGLAICTATGDQTSIKAVSDGGAGIWVVWNDNRSGITKNYASHIDVAGAIQAGIPANGLLLDSVRPNSQGPPQIAADSNNGLFVVWQYAFGGTDYDIYGARVGTNNALVWSTVMAGSGAVQSAPVCDISGSEWHFAYMEGGTTVLAARLTVATGAVFGSPATITVNATPASIIRMCPDGQSGSMIAWVNNNAGAHQVGVYRYLGGSAYQFAGYAGALTANTVTLCDVLYNGSLNMWLVWSTGATAGAQVVSANLLTRNSVGPQTALSSGADIGTAPVLAAHDGTGGVLSAYGSTTYGDQVAGARVMLGPVEPPMWTSYGADGQFILQNRSGTLPAAMANDGQGGMFIFGYDRSYFPQYTFMYHVDKWGAYNAEPSGLTAKDVLGDQGGKVRLTWNASYLDKPFNGAIAAYRVWRQVPSALAQARLRAGAREYREGAALQPGMLRMQPDAASAFAWEYVNSQIAAGFPQYSYVAPTGQDSIGAGTYDNTFMVEATHNFYNIAWQSVPAAGHSVDNLPPVIPAPFAANYSAGVTHLHWGANSEADLGGYKLYRGSSAAFVPGPGNLVTTTTDTLAADAAVGQWYKLAAFDAHGNMSGFATLGPGNTLDAPGDALPHELTFALASANPSHDAVTLRFALPRAATVRVGVYDVRGRLVRELASGANAAGTYSLRWDGSDASGAAAGDGIYFARLACEGRTITQRIVRMR